MKVVDQQTGEDITDKIKAQRDSERSERGDEPREPREGREGGREGGPQPPWRAPPRGGRVIALPLTI